MKNMKSKSDILKECRKKIEERGINLPQVLFEKYPKNIPEFVLSVRTVNIVISVLEELGYPVRYYGACVYIFNGTYWEQFAEKERQRVLSASAQAMRINVEKALHHRFIKEMDEQFCVSVHKIKTEDVENQIYINVQNGTLTHTGGKAELLPHDKQQFLRYFLPYDYDPDAKCPLFQKFLDDVLPTDLQQQVQEYFAYILSPHLKLRKVLFLYGYGANGKSVLIKILSAVLGKENIVERSLEGLCAYESRSVADIDGKLLVVCGEMSAKFDISNFKSLAVGDPIQARRLHKETHTIYNYGRFLISCNEMPRQIEHTKAFFDRILLVPFLRRFTVEEQDPFLADKIIKEELPGILNWGLEALPRLLEQQHFSYCETSEEALDEYQRQIDSVASFIYDNNYQTSTSSFLSFKYLLSEYGEYCKEMNCYACGRSSFSQRLKMMGYKDVRKSGGMFFYINRKDVVDKENAQLFSSIDVKTNSEAGMTLNDFIDMCTKKEVQLERLSIVQ